MSAINNPKILIVDDEPDILNFLRNLLMQEDYDVKTASDGPEAIDLFRSEPEPFDLVITDIRMPGMDGLEVMKQIKVLDEDVEIIILTGFATIENAVQTLKADGAFDYLTKPLENINELLNTINQALRKRELKIENRALLKKLEKETESQKDAAKQIQKSKSLLQSVVDGISEPLIMLDDSLSVKMLNKAATEYFKTNFQDAVGKPCYDIFMIKSAPCEGCKICSKISTGNQAVFERKGIVDENRVEQVDIYPLKGTETEGTIIRISDITEKKKIQEQLNRADRLSSLGHLSGGIAHEIRNPLAGMSLFLDILSDEKRFEKTDEELEILNDMKDGVNKIAGIIRRVIDFSRLSVISSGILEINTLIRDTIKLWEEKFRTLNIKRALSLAVDLPPVHGDYIGLQQVMNNLILNAIEAMEMDGVLHISTSKGLSSFHNNFEVVVVNIKDSGPGIVQEQLEKVFNPFFTTKATGTGLGLAITHQIIKHHGGFISLESEPGKGTTFTIELPCMPAKPSESSPQLASGPEGVIE